MTTATLTRRPATKDMGAAVLLVYGLLVPVPRDGKPGFRLTVQLDGAVWVQPVGFELRHEGFLAALDLQIKCRQLGLQLEPIPIPGQPPGFVVRRRPRPIP